MAYISQEEKKQLAPAIKAVLKKYGVKGTIAIDNHSTLVVNISRGPLDLLQGCGRDYRRVNEFYIDSNFEGESRDFLNELLVAMKGTEWYDRSEPMTDYFNTAYYLAIKVGRYNKPYVFEAGPDSPLDFAGRAG